MINRCLITKRSPLVPITCTPPIIVTPPVGQTILFGESATLFVIATGTNLRYEWKKNEVILNDEIASSFPVIYGQTSDTGIYSVRVYNECGSVESDPVLLDINDTGNINIGGEGLLGNL